MSATATATDVPALRFDGVSHEGIPCDKDKLPDLIAFFRDVLGLTQIPRPPALDAMGSGAWMVDADRTVSFHLIVNENTLRPGSDAKITPAGRHTAWKIRDVGAFRARMTALGVPFQEIGNLTGDPQLFLLDPQGHTWEFQGPPGQK